MFQNRCPEVCSSRLRPRLWALVILLAWAGLSCAANTNLPTTVRTLATEAPNFQEMTQKYYLDRSLDFVQEILLKEEVLAVLYKCTAKEVKARKKEGLIPALLESPLWKVESAPLNREEPSLQNAPLAQRYQVWVNYEDQEYSRRFELVMHLRSELIKNGSAAQNDRMFRRELEKALHFYGRAEWDLARLLFDRLLEDYNFHNLDDILYYQSQSCMQLQLLDCALDYCNRLITTCPDSKYRPQSYDLATSILQAYGSGREIRKLYASYLQEGSPGDPVLMGGVHVRAARAEVDLGHYQVAADILARVPQKSSYYLVSRYLLADCWAALEDWPHAVEALAAMAAMKQEKMPYERWRLLTDEARIKLAFIYYKWGDYDKAATYFDQVRSNSPFYDRVLLGHAWIAFQLDNYQETIAQSEELLKLYPTSTEIYEASSLAGYCYEQMGDKNAAYAHFLEVLEAGVGRSQLQSFLEERRRLSESMADLQALEEEVFSSQDEKLFSDYKRARNQLWICQQRLGLAELLQVNARMRSMVEERTALDSLLAAQAVLEKSLSLAENAGFISQFLNIEDRIYTCLGHLKAVGKEQLKSTPLYYKEAQVGYINTRTDSLANRLENEIVNLISSIQSVQNLKQAARDKADPTDCLQLGLRLDHLEAVLDKSYLSKTETFSARRPVLKTRVDRWSDFSFNRYAMGGMDLEELDRKYERLQQVEDYINTLDELLDLRKKESQPLGAATEQP